MSPVELLPPHRKGVTPSVATLAAFFAKVRVGERGCWVWIGATARFGYGCIRVNQRLHSAHRLSYHWFVGELTPDVVVRHKCDNPACVNPAHLQAGSHRDNVYDTIARGRKVQVRGERVGTAKLATDDVIEIRRLVASRALSRRAIGRLFGISHTQVSYIADRKSWRHLVGQS